ncbi:MAG: hypothetical protein KatS3mg123_0001 [Burkholderiales bacterium]|nr:MAG: hypothetical protein KatS3mg123_0001 [Burkholderiales bacterium]
MSGDARPVPRGCGRCRAPRPRVRHRGRALRHRANPSGGEIPGAEGESGGEPFRAPGNHPSPRHRGRDGWPLLRPGPGGWGSRTGVDPGPGRRAAPGARAGGAAGALVGEADPHRFPGVPRGGARAIRLLLVHPRPGQVPQAPGGGAGGLPLSPALRLGDAPLFPGGDGQGAGAPGLQHPHGSGRGASGGVPVRGAAVGASHLRVLPYREPHRRGAGRAAVPPSPGAAARLLRGAPGGGFGGPGAGAGAHPAVPDRPGAYRAARSRLLGGVHRGDAALLGSAYLDRAHVASLLRPSLGAGHPGTAGQIEREVRPRRREPGLSWWSPSPASTR